MEQHEDQAQMIVLAALSILLEGQPNKMLVVPEAWFNQQESSNLNIIVGVNAEGEVFAALVQGEIQ